MDKNKFDFEDNIDFDFGGNIRFNFDTVIFQSIMSLNRVFDGEVSIEEGFAKYRHIVEHLVVVANATGMLPKDYDSLEQDILSNIPSQLSSSERSAYIARKKLAVIVQNVQKKTPRREPLKVN